MGKTPSLVDVMVMLFSAVFHLCADFVVLKVERKMRFILNNIIFIHLSLPQRPLSILQLEILAQEIHRDQLQRCIQRHKFVDMTQVVERTILLNIYYHL